MKLYKRIICISFLSLTSQALAMETQVLNKSLSRSPSAESIERIDATEESLPIDLDQRKDAVFEKNSRAFQESILADSEKSLTDVKKLKDQLVAVKQVQLAVHLKTRTAFEKADQELSATQKELDSLDQIEQTLKTTVQNINAQLEGYDMIERQQPHKSLNNTNHNFLSLLQGAQVLLASLTERFS